MKEQLKKLNRIKRLAATILMARKILWEDRRNFNTNQTNSDAIKRAMEETGLNSISMQVIQKLMAEKDVYSRASLILSQNHPKIALELTRSG